MKAERKAGEMLRDMAKNPGTICSGGSVVLPPADSPPKLEEIGVTKDQSSKWQRIAKIPEPEFEAYI